MIFHKVEFVSVWKILASNCVVNHGHFETTLDDDLETDISYLDQRLAFSIFCSKMVAHKKIQARYNAKKHFQLFTPELINRHKKPSQLSHI